jgi:hypothetical protein
MSNFFQSMSKPWAKVMGRSVVKLPLILRSLETKFASGINANPKLRENARSFVDDHDADHDIS